MPRWLAILILILLLTAPLQAQSPPPAPSPAPAPAADVERPAPILQFVIASAVIGLILTIVLMPARKNR